MAPPDKDRKSLSDGDSLDDLKGELDALLGGEPAANDEPLDDLKGELDTMFSEAPATEDGSLDDLDDSLDSLPSDADEAPEDTSYEEAAPDTGAPGLPEDDYLSEDDGDLLGDDELPAEDASLFGAGAEEGPFDIAPDEPEEEEEEEEEEEAGFTTTFESSGPTFGERMQAGFDHVTAFIGDISLWGWGAIFTITILMVALILGVHSLLGAGDDLDAYQNSLFWAMILMLVGLVMAAYLSLYEVIHEWFVALAEGFSKPQPEATGALPDNDEAGEDDADHLLE